MKGSTSPEDCEEVPPPWGDAADLKGSSPPDEAAEGGGAGGGGAALAAAA
ncbi:MAG: hypothetical protein L0213_04185 [Candidatus Dadabacteria bacterium]|nr:hypothetical protein [Candidatus Dadabacteria bacterium]